MNRCVALAAWVVLAAASGGAQPAAGADVPFRERIVDKQDGAFDLSDHLLEHRGFMPVPLIVTEPATGYGGGAALLFFRESISGARAQSLAAGTRMTPPDIGVIAAFKTENGSQGGAAGYFGTLHGDRYRYLFGAAKADLNLDYYGPGSVPRRFALEIPALIVQGLARIGETDWLVGPRYIYAGTKAKFANDTPSTVATRDLDASIGRLSLIVDYDSRDNIFTPSRGSFVEIDVGVSRDWLGSASDFEAVLARGFTYLPLSSGVVLGLRADGKFTSGDTPFYVRPFISLRGIPAIRYQGRHAAVVEAELRYNLDERWALVGFGGVGRTFGSDGLFAAPKTAGAGGVGFRYLIARKLGMYAGIDVARGPEETAFYIQVGSAWR